MPRSTKVILGKHDIGTTRGLQRRVAELARTGTPAAQDAAIKRAQDIADSVNSIAAERKKDAVAEKHKARMQAAGFDPTPQRIGYLSVFSLERAFLAVVEQNFDQATDDFKKNPAHLNWRRLITASEALRFLKSDAGMSWALQNLQDTGVGHWPNLLAEQAHTATP